MIEGGASTISSGKKEARAGGELKAPTLSLTGGQAAAIFEHIFVSTLFLATAWLSFESGLMFPGLADLPVKRAKMRTARRITLLADSSKNRQGLLCSRGGGSRGMTSRREANRSPSTGAC